MMNIQNIKNFVREYLVSRGITLTRAYSHQEMMDIVCEAVYQITHEANGDFQHIKCDVQGHFLIDPKIEKRIKKLEIYTRLLFKACDAIVDLKQKTISLSHHAGVTVWLDDEEIDILRGD